MGVHGQPGLEIALPVEYDGDELWITCTGRTHLNDHLAAHVLSPDAANVVREGEYTVHRRDGSSSRSYMVMTTLWARRGDGWEMVHLHESAYPL